MNLKGKKAVFMSMNLYFGGRTDTGTKEEAFIQASTDAGATWTTVSEIEPSLNDSKTGILWKTQTFNLSAYNKDTAVWVAIKFTDNDGYLYGIAIDNVKVYEPAAIEGAFKLDAYKKYALKSNAVEVKGKISNLGASTITDLEMSYTVAGKTETKKLSNLSIAPLTTEEVTHPTAYNYAATGAHAFDVKITKINGVSDADSTNNAGVFKTVVISKNVQRKVVFEEATGTWCVWCPRGTVFMDSMAKEYKKDFIGVAVHNGTNDPMKVVIYDAGLTKTPGFTGFPGVVIDRTEVIDPAEMFDVFDAARAELNPFALTQKVTYDSLTRKLTVDLKTKATMTNKGDYRFNVIISEDGVKGTTSGYAQANAYSGGSAGVMGGYEKLPNPVPANKMVYNHVGRAILGDYAGKLGSIPADVKEGDEYAYTFTYTVPTTMKPANMHVVGVVLDAETGTIMTGASDNLVQKFGVGIKDLLNNEAVSIYPNPMADETNIEVTTTEAVEVSVSVFNTLGQQVASRSYGKLSGENILPFVAGDLANGIYTIHVKMGDKLAVKKVTVQK
jgi:thiol-disulfide isomerase/thioredoxin